MKHSRIINLGEKKLCTTINCILQLTFIVEHRPWSSTVACACAARTDSSRLSRRACADTVADPGFFGRIRPLKNLGPGLFLKSICQ